MKQLLSLMLFAFVVIGVNAQVGTIPTITGSNSGDGEIQLIVAAAQSNDDLLEDRLDSLKGSVDLDATSSTSYYDMINSEWTPTAHNTSGGSNGIYSIINPVYNFQNAYGLRARVDMRDAADSVGLNQTHAIDGLINLSDQDYWVDDNISVFSGAIHSEGITAGDIDSIGTLNLYHGVFPSSLTENFTVETNAMKIITFSATHCDYGFNFENSGTTTAGIYLNNHASNSPATMTSGILMKSAASKMTYGVNMTDAGITGADILLQEGEKIDNITNGTVKVTATTLESTGNIKIAVTAGNTHDTVPTDGELDTILGTTPAGAGAGAMFLVVDNATGSALFLVMSDGSHWCWIITTVAT